MDMMQYADSVREDAEDFMLANCLAHEQIGESLLSSGKYINMVPLTDMSIDDPIWLFAHDQLHRQEYELIGLTEMTDLASVDMNNEQAYHDWMQRHSLVHQQVNLALGL